MKRKFDELEEFPRKLQRITQRSPSYVSFMFNEPVDISLSQLAQQLRYKLTKKQNRGVWNNNVLVCGSGDHIDIINVNTGKEVSNIEDSNSLWSIIQLRNENRMVYGDSNGVLHLYDLKERGEVKQQRQSDDSIRSIMQLWNGEIVSGTWTGNLNCYDPNTLELLRTGYTQSNAAATSMVQISETRMALALTSHFVSIHNTRTLQLIRNLKGHMNSVMCVVLLSDGKLASGSFDQTVRIWDVDTGECIRVLNGHAKNIWSIIQLEDHKLVSCGYDNTARIWNVYTGECLKVLPSDEKHCLYNMVLLPGGDFICVGGAIHRYSPGQNSLTEVHPHHALLYAVVPIQEY
jgi:WD40 repeat protein